MKSIRVSILTMCLLVGATLGPVPTAEDATTAGSRTIASAETECYLINGIWICER